MTQAEYLPLLVDRLVEAFHPLRIILFGSVSRGEEHPDSDFDLVLVFGEHGDALPARWQVEEAIEEIPFHKDIHLTTPSELEKSRYRYATVLRPALLEGKVLYDDGYIRYMNEHGVDVSPPDPNAECELWLRYAHEDMLHAKDCATRADTPARIVCFHAQQAAEKAIKALLIHLRVIAPRTHDLQELVDLVPAGWRIKSLNLEFKPFRYWAVDNRYPDALRSATTGEATDLLAAAHQIWDAISGDLGRRGIHPEGHAPEGR